MEDNLTLTILCDLITTVERQVDRFPVGSAQHTLQVNRLSALNIALAIHNDVELTHAELTLGVAPLTSLISKSEKALTKLDPNAWQAQRLTAQLAVLRPLLNRLHDRLSS